MMLVALVATTMLMEMHRGEDFDTATHTTWRLLKRSIAILPVRTAKPAYLPRTDIGKLHPVCQAVRIEGKFPSCRTQNHEARP